MSAANEPSAEATKTTRKSVTALRGPLLGLLVNQDRPNHLYRITGLLAQYLPPWQVSRGGVKHVLQVLVKEGLVRSAESDDQKTVFIPLDGAWCALDEWMEEAVSHPSVRDELHARIVSSSPSHAPLLVEALGVFERECYARLDGAPVVAEAGMESWRSLTISSIRAAEDEDTRAKIKWAQDTRKAIKDYVKRSAHD